MYLDGKVAGDELAELLRDAYRLVAPNKLRLVLDALRAPSGARRGPATA